MLSSIGIYHESVLKLVQCLLEKGEFYAKGSEYFRIKQYFMKDKSPKETKGKLMMINLLNRFELLMRGFIK